MRRRTSHLGLVLLLLAGCGVPGVPAVPGGQGTEPAERRVLATDGSMSLVVPDGWEAVDDTLPAGVGFAATEAGDETQQLIVRTSSSADAAEDAAVFAAVGFVDQGGVCRRLEGDTTYGVPHLVFDCPFTEPTAIRKVLVTVVEGDRAVLVLAQLHGETLEDTADVLAPFLAGIVWA